MKPIEAGCLAVVVGPIPENTGKTVRVLSPVGVNGRWSKSPLWRIDRNVISWDGRLRPNPNFIVRMYPEAYLMRIDGHEETEEIEEAATA